MKPFWSLLAVPLILVSCTNVEELSPVEAGARLFRTSSFTGPRDGGFSCATCHAAETMPARTELRMSGAPLGGVVSRATYWGGAETDLLRAVDNCRRYFGAASAPLDRDTEETRALYAYLLSLPETEKGAVPFTVVRTIADLPAPPASNNGQALYKAACGNCHGDAHTAEGRAFPHAVRLPEDTLAEHTYLSTPEDLRGVFIEKVRHGPFFGYAGVMPPLSTEALTDDELAQILRYLGLYK